MCVYIRLVISEFLHFRNFTLALRHYRNRRTDSRHDVAGNSRIEIIGDKGMICFSVFTYEPIGLHTEKGREEICIGNPELSLEMMQLLERVSKMGITVLVVTHEHELVHRFHQRVVTLSHGRIVSDVPADPVAAAEDDLSLDVAAFDADDAKKEVAAV